MTFSVIGNINSSEAYQTSEKARSHQNKNSLSGSYNDVDGNYLNILLIAGSGFIVGISTTFITLRHTIRKIKNQENLQKELESLNKVTESNVKFMNAQKDSDSYYLCIKQAYNCVNQGNVEGAIAHFNEAVRIKPNSEKIYSERANFRKNKLSDRQGALEDYTTAIDINPNNALLYFWRSQTYQEMGNQQKAIEDYNTAMSLAPDESIYYSFPEDKKVN
ncbi:MAG: tetratricopeptide repeat protein [Calothrix sp. SM1_7_51]|nr:tetratricopeptide repeat protein [Calothrix sp. SM1_7_51]